MAIIKMTKEEYEKKYGSSSIPIKKETQTITQEGQRGLAGVATGVAKGVLSTVKGAGQLGEKILPPATGKSVYSDEATRGTILDEERLKAKSTAEKIGKFGEQVAEFAIPGSQITKATKGASLGTKVLARGLTSGTVGAIQSGDVGKEAVIAGGIDAGLPVAGKLLKPVGKVISSVFRGLGGGFAGVSENTLKTIQQNAKTAKDTVSLIKNSGQEEVLKKNVKTIIDGASKIKKESSENFAKALEQLSRTDIKPQIVQEEAINALKKSGVDIIDNVVDLNNTEIFNPQIQSRAVKLITDINKLPVNNGKELRTIIQKLESSKLNAGIDPDRIAFNDLIDNMVDGFQTAINRSTDKLGKANLAYSQDRGLLDAIQKTLGTVKFKNDSEILAISKKLETLFAQKGLSENYIDSFLKRIGINPSEFKTSEAVRQISTKELGTNTLGTNLFEAIRIISSKVLTPQMVRDAAILTGRSEPVIKKLLENTSPTARGLLIKTLISKED